MKKIVYLVVIILAVLFFGKMAVDFDVTKISTASANDLNLFKLAADDLIANQLTVEKDVNVKGMIYNNKKYKKNPVKIADNLVPSKNKKANLGSAKKYWKNGYINTLNINNLNGQVVGTDNIIANSVTQTDESYGIAVQQTTATYPNFDYLTEQVTLTTTGNSTFFCTFSGVLNSNTNGSQARIILVVDGQPITQSIRRGTSMLVGVENRTFTLATNALVNVTAGTHTVQIGWETDYATIAYMYNHTLDVIELKR